MEVTLHSNEPLAALLVLQPGAAVWATVSVVRDPASPRHWTMPVSVNIGATVETDGWHCIQVKGVDQAGNVQTKGLHFFWELDRTAPDVWLSGFAQLPFITSSASMMFSAQWSEVTASVWWAVDNGGWNALLNTVSFTATVKGDGKHSLHLKVLDQVGNEFVNSSVWVWTLDTAPPVSKLTQMPDSPSSISTPTFEVSCLSVAPDGRSDCAVFNYTVQLASVKDCGVQRTHSGVVASFGGNSSVLELFGIRSGENTLVVTAVDEVGLRQLVPQTFTWTVQLASDEIMVTILSGPPSVYAYRDAVFHLYAHQNGTRVSSGNAKIEMKLNEGSWSEITLSCNLVDGMCNHTISAELGSHDIQIRAVDRASSIAGAPALWRWTVKECSDTEYAFVNVTDGGSLECVPCPLGGDCKAKNATAYTLVAKAGWWVPPQGPRLTLYRCPFPDSCAGNGARCNNTQGFKNSTVCGQCLSTHVRQGEACTFCPETGEVMCGALNFNLKPQFHPFLHLLSRAISASPSLSRCCRCWQC